jgi:uncharacterized iron-regulated protein
VVFVGTMTTRSSVARSLALVLLVAGCAGRPIPPTPVDPRAYSGERWKSPLELDHRLVGYALSVEDERWVDAKEIAAAVAGAEFVFLGETHDNEDHHRIQSELLRAALAGGRSPALAFEMLDTRQAEPLATALASGAATPEGIAEAVGWGKSGWPDFAIYRPIFEVGLEAGLELVAANLPRPVAREAGMKGPAVLPDDVRQALERQGEPTAEEWKAWTREMAESHCQEFPREQIAGMVLAQRARDVQMALRVGAAGARRGAVLITGGGHARSDRGVPAWLERLHPGARSISVGLVEVDGERRWPRLYTESYGADRFPFDYVIFTPRAEREDPCEKLKRRNREAEKRPR